MKKTSGLLALMLALTLVVLPGVAHSAMWVGGEVGGSLFANQDVTQLGKGVTFANQKVEPSVIGGIQVGYDFVKTGFLGCNWPEWMKYFSFATDFTYNRMWMRDQQGADPFDKSGITNGYMATLSFLFIAKYGFFCDSEVPFGRLQPYVGVGPAVLFSGGKFGEDLTPGQNSSSTNIALVAEGGLRYFALKSVSLDAAFRYLHSRPTYHVADPGDTEGGWNIRYNIDQFSFLFRANLHF
jgi:opacity protein-like surface antigen